MYWHEADAAGSSSEGSEPYEQKVGYGRHATHLEGWMSSGTIKVQG